MDGDRINTLWGKSYVTEFFLPPTLLVSHSLSANDKTIMKEYKNPLNYFVLYHLVIIILETQNFHKNSRSCVLHFSLQFYILDIHLGLI